MIRVADYIAQRLADEGLRHVFMVTGGGAMHLNDAFGREPRLAVMPVHHEQSAAMAAESYARFCGKPAVVNVTTGPGGVNALNGVFGAFTDSVPMIVVSGQVKRETMLGSYPHLPLRQLGDQEVDIVRMVAGITKMAVVLYDPSDVRSMVEEALLMAVSGRPGPVWIDVPGDVQGALVDADQLAPHVPVSHPVPATLPQPLSADALPAAAAAVVARLRKAQRPVVFVGGGIRASNSYTSFLRWAETVGAPVVTGWNAHDLLPSDHPLYAGRPGTLGDRGGNFAVQNADLVLVLGSRLNIRQISYNWEAFARFANIVMVDADPAELAKPTLKVAEAICADLKEFLPALQAASQSYEVPQGHRDYLAWIQERIARYPVVLPSYWETASPINPYCFVERLFAQLKQDDTVVTADGTACVVTFQVAQIKQGQRLYTNSGSASMGYDLPAAIGAVTAGAAEKTGRLTCLAGDGSIMMNIQELATIAGHGMPVKIFLLNNDGYHSIRQSQQAYFSDNIVGCGPDSALPFPNFLDVARAFGFGTRRIINLEELDQGIASTLDAAGPQFCEVLLDKRQVFAPRLSSRRLEDGTMVSAPLEDLAPFLSREELAQNMLVGAPGD